MNDQKECNGDEQRRNTLICAYSKVIFEWGYKIGDQSNSRQIVLHVIRNMNINGSKYKYEETANRMYKFFAM